MGDFNGHIGLLGKQKLNRNGKVVLNLMEKYNLILLNMDANCCGETTRSQNNEQSTIDYVLVN